MHRHHVVTKRPHRTAGTSMTMSVFGGPMQSHQHLQDVEMYSKMYYKDHVKWAVYECLKNPGSGKVLTVVREETKKHLENEDSVMKQAVMEAMSNAQEVALAVNQGDSSEHTGEQFQV